MTDGDALRGAIIAQPDDDTLRLVYADWLDENGQPDRAAFIRAQVWAAQADPFGPEARKHAATAKRLLDPARQAWAKRVHPWVLAAEFRRGFIDHATVNVATFPRDAAALFAAEPVRSLRMVRTAPEHELDPFFGTPQLARVTRLDLTNLWVAPYEIELLFECPHLAPLTDLGLRNTPVPPDRLAALLIGTALPALAGLDLADVANLGPCLASALSRADHRRFARLDLSRIRFTSHEIKQILASRCLRNVEELFLGWMPQSGREGALTHLDLSFGIIPWNRLRTLDLNGQGVGDPGTEQIVMELNRRRDPAPLRRLSLANNRVRADGVRALIHSDSTKLNLYHLDMSGNGLTLSQRAALQTRFPDAVIVD
ncbi:TIGR02996 domain-containing protein [Frigoriglobus tundricola]|uniref:Repeat-companion domain protein n=1 Tax=Frigoriglobus tundricola TaxID=2774151 RepID=A0A6M5Z1X0_9BACT|nr:TIGR02996 domain-containing protein [Frigoriglobus tundricola]QJW99600.1 hypothetical protein FTUN_7212 [Frigoriglobus tundricola]